MDKMIDVPTFTHVVKISDRKNIVISGIKKIISFDDKEFLLESSLGNIIIKGTDLEMIKLDTVDGNVSIKGKVDSFSYTDIVNKEESMLSKLFK
ncbi:MAG TPA: sporulation protein YabP [Mollicutes bacterium]|nr:sporulation protein YabP [Mollicutes bacterium]